MVPSDCSEPNGSLPVGEPAANALPRLCSFRAGAPCATELPRFHAVDATPTVVSPRLANRVFDPNPLPAVFSVPEMLQRVFELLYQFAPRSPLTSEPTPLSDSTW